MSVDSNLTARPLARDGGNGAQGVYVTTDGQTLTAHSPKADIESIEVFDYDGRSVASAKASAATRTLSITTNVQIGVLRIHLKDLPPVTQKFIKQ